LTRSTTVLSAVVNVTANSSTAIPFSVATTRRDIAERDQGEFRNRRNDGQASIENDLKV
jgi:hypothetical protein